MPIVYLKRRPLHVSSTIDVVNIYGKTSKSFLHFQAYLNTGVALVFEKVPRGTWWRHQMETFFAILAICAGNSPVPGEVPAHRPMTRSFDVSFDLRLNKRLNKQSWGWWFETLPRPLWRQCNDEPINSSIQYSHYDGVVTKAPGHQQPWYGLISPVTYRFHQQNRKHIKACIKWTILWRRNVKCILMSTVVPWLKIHWSISPRAPFKRNQCWLINGLVPNLVWIGGDPVHWHIFASQAAMYYIIIWPPNVWRFNRYKI